MKNNNTMKIDTMDKLGYLIEELFSLYRSTSDCCTHCDPCTFCKYSQGFVKSSLSLLQRNNIIFLDNIFVKDCLLLLQPPLQKEAQKLKEIQKKKRKKNDKLKK